VTFPARRDFSIIAPYKYFYLLTYLLTAEFLVNKYLWQFCGKAHANHVV